MSENEVLMKVFGPKGDKINSAEDYIRGASMICTADHILFGDKSRMGGACGTQWVTGEVQKRF
jgi:hypothetical protein